jgi:hypothetical protein
MRSIRDSGGCRDDIETDGGAAILVAPASKRTSRSGLTISVHRVESDSPRTALCFERSARSGKRAADARSITPQT